MLKHLSLHSSLLAASLAVSCSLLAQLPQPNGGDLERGVLPTHWLSEGPKCMEIPEWQVHEYNANFFILRQSGCTDFEKPFLFLLFGKQRALLVDTGSRKGDLAPTLQRTVHSWLERNHRSSFPLSVVHTHEHEDHTAGDAAVQAMNDAAIPVTFVPSEVEATKKFFHIEHWPTQAGQVDLGDRIVDLVPIPGHSKVSVAFYDRNTGVLLSGDSLYPGRLYVVDFPAFQSSVDRLVHFTEGKPVAQVLGNHIEQTDTPFLDYAVGTIYQPHEHELQLSRGSLLELEDAVHSMHGKPARRAMRDFSVWPVGPAFMSPGEAAQFEQHRKEEKQTMWDHIPH